MKKIFGVGINNREVKIFKEGKVVRDYTIWHNMIRRCYSDVYQKDNPTYKDCEVSENFKHYSFFRKWVVGQVGFSNPDWHFDKDILGDGKLYCEEVCVFIPQELNTIFLQGNKRSSDLPLGVSYKSANRKYVAQCRMNGKEVHLGLFSDVESAKLAYDAAKRIEIDRLISKYESSLDKRVVDKLRLQT